MKEERLTSILVDDEKDGQELLQNLLNRYFPEIEIQGIASGVDEAYELIGRFGPDLVFLDIQMPGSNGFDLLRRYTDLPFEVIFVTGFDQYAINAIRFSALDYLTKPVDVNELFEAVKRARKSISARKENRSYIVQLLHNLDAAPADKKIAIHNSEKVHILNASEIEYIEADGRYSKICMSNGAVFLTARNLREFEDYLGGSSAFIRVHKSIIINTAQVAAYQKGSLCIVELRSGKSIEVSRRRKQEILDLLQRL